VTTRPALDEPHILHADTIGQAWLAVAGRIAAAGLGSATITTFQPQTDTTYIPCVSLLDFWLPGGAVELVVYAHSIDFGAKGYGNLVERPAGQLTGGARHSRRATVNGSLTSIRCKGIIYM
jgi:hypothetical protein